MPLIAPVDSAPQPTTTASTEQAPAKLFHDSTPIVSTSKIPIVNLDVDAVTDTAAARLATSLLGHVLFLKSQIPLPVQQLARIPSSKSTARAVKHRAELLNSFDTLASHLNTTFTAISTALEQVKRASRSSRGVEERSRVFLAILVGPTMNSSRSKVMFAVDGFKTKVWGEAEMKEKKTTEDTVDQEDDEGVSSDEGDEAEEDECEDVDENENEEDKANDDEDNEDDDKDDEGDTDPDGNEAGSDEDSVNSDSNHDTPPSTPPPPSTLSHAEELRTLLAAERLLARTLAASDAEGNDMFSELAPTQTHILLRAPRRFVHPAWVPRQNMTTSMDAALEEFLEQSEGSRTTGTDTARQKTKKKRKVDVEGVWVTDRQGLIPLDGGGLGVASEEDEQDEMIWWSWDGKIVGFSEW